MLVTHGFLLHRFPELPAVPRETRCRLEVSQHGTHDEYLKRFRSVKELVRIWQKQYRRLKVRIRRSHVGWMRQYNVVDGKPMPFDSDPVAAHEVCMQRSCTQLVNGCLAKCPALAYWPKLEANAHLESIPEWQLLRDYQMCSPESTDDELCAFIETNAIPQCDQHRYFGRNLPRCSKQPKLQLAEFAKLDRTALP